MRESLRVLEQRVKAHGFLRAHRCALVRLEGVHKLVSSNGELSAVIGSNVSIPISRRRRASFTAALAGFVESSRDTGT